MNATLCRTLKKMFDDGFRQYAGEIDSQVYEQLGCKDASRAYWICRWPILHCLGCNRRCTPKTPTGFQVPLVTSPARQGSGKRFSLTPEEMVASKTLLRVDEAAYCLNVSERTVRKLVDEGVLARHLRQPIRVTAESVRAEMERVEY